MTEAERELSNARRAQIAMQNRASNRHRPNRVISPTNRGDELLARIGVTLPDGERDVDWAALTRSG